MAAVPLLAVLASAGWACGGMSCPTRFEVLAVVTADKSIPCCSTIAVRDFAIASGFPNDTEVDVAVHRDPSASAQVEAWLTAADCAQLFDAGSSAPKCTILIGPVAAGSVSPRRKMGYGTYRIFVRPTTIVESDVPFLVDVRIWGSRCSASPIGP